MGAKGGFYEEDCFYTEDGFVIRGRFPCRGFGAEVYYVVVCGYRSISLYLSLLIGWSGGVCGGTVGRTDGYRLFFLTQCVLFCSCVFCVSFVEFYSVHGVVL